jgi:hypothetical protein
MRQMEDFVILLAFYEIVNGLYGLIPFIDIELVALQVR